MAKLLNRSTLLRTLNTEHQVDISLFLHSSLNMCIYFEYHSIDGTTDLPTDGPALLSIHPFNHFLWNLLLFPQIDTICLNNYHTEYTQNELFPSLLNFEC